MNKFSLQRMSNKGKPFSPMGRVFPCNVFSGLGKEVFWDQGRHWMQAVQNCTPALCFPVAVPWYAQCSPCQEQRAGLVGDFICPQLYLVVQCQCGGDSRTLLGSWMWGAAQPAFRGAPSVYLGGSLGAVYYCFSAIRWKSALGQGLSLVTSSCKNKASKAAWKGGFCALVQRPHVIAHPTQGALQVYELLMLF